MNIYIYNCSNTFNYGSMMMGENFISYFNKVSGVKNNYYVETEDEINVERLKNATKVNEIYPARTNSLFINGLNKYDYIFSYMNLKKVISDFAGKINLVIVLGGDDFTEDYGWKGLLLNGIKFNILIRAGLKVVMLGQTMGPYHPLRKGIMKRLLRKITNIYTRDSITYNYLKDLGLKNISITDDLALLSLAKQQSKIETKEYITFCPSELIYRYSKDGKREDWIDFNLFMIDTIMGIFQNKKIVLLAHVLKPEHVDDRIIANELYCLVNNKYPNRVIIQTNEMYPYEVRNFIQQSLFIVSSRMHPIVSSIQCEIPAIALSYSSKYWGIIGERYGLGDFILDIRHSNYNQMKDKFVELMDKIQSEYKLIQETMKNNNKLANENIVKALSEIAKLNSVEK